jgi:hypothetical protein
VSVVGVEEAAEVEGIFERGSRESVD